MKVNFVKRLVLILHWIMSLVAAAMALLFCVWPDTIYGLFNKLYALIGTRKSDIIAMAALAVYVVLAVVSAIILFSSRRKQQRGFIMVDSSDTGKTRIAVSAVEQMIRQAVRGVDGISEIKSRIINHEDAISINTNVSVAAGAHVPTVTMNIQRAIRSYIELNCGVAVRDISVNVHSVEMDGDSGKRPARKPAPAERAYEATAAEKAPEIPTQKAFEQKPVYREPEVQRPTFDSAPAKEAVQPTFDDADAPIRLTFTPPEDMVDDEHPTADLPEDEM